MSITERNATSMSDEDDDNYPFSGYPTGWFQVAWSAELPVGEVKPMRYFGRDLIAYRSEGGKVHVHDAHCPHLGAHIGYGGIVEGECVRCPYHGWKFDAEGRNVEIPDARSHKGVQLRPWTTHEEHDLVLVWNDDQGREPLWDPPTIPECSSGDYYEPFPKLTKLWQNLPIRPQYIVENTVDVRHQQWVHGSRSEHELVEWEINGPMCRTRQRLTFGAGKKSTWLTPEGPREAFLDVECWGIGINVARFIGTDNAAHIGCHTPIDERHLDERLTIIQQKPSTSRGEPDEGVLKRFTFEVKQVEHDIVIWQNMRYVRRPPFTSDEARTWTEFRDWAASFYV